jgi:hypothetical protein
LPIAGADWRVTKIAIDKHARESENREHEENGFRALHAAGRVRGEKDTGCSDAASNTKPASATIRRTHRTLRDTEAGKRQHRDLQLCAREDRDRLKNWAYHVGVQGHERGKVRLGLLPFH